MSRPKNPDQTCTVSGCLKPLCAHGLCAMHDRRVRRTGDVNGVRTSSGGRGKPRPRKRGVGNPNWRGDRITYGGAHVRLHATRGSASALPCVACGAPALHWAYRHGSPAEQCDERGYAFSPDPADYDPMCVPCHSVRDRTKE